MTKLRPDFQRYTEDGEWKALTNSACFRMWQSLGLYHWLYLSIISILVHIHINTHAGTHTSSLCAHGGLVWKRKIISATLRHVRLPTMTHFQRGCPKKDQVSKTVISAVTAVPSRHDSSSVEKTARHSRRHLSSSPAHTGGFHLSQCRFHKSKDARHWSRFLVPLSLMTTLHTHG